MSSSSQKIVYFVRHGQSVDNASPIYQSVNSPLSAKGKDQAAGIAERLTHIEFEALVSSPVLRAKETAQCISDKTHKAIIISDLFKERVRPSETDGKPHADEVASKLWREWEESLYTSGLRVSDGENYDDITARTDKALDFLVNRPETTLAVVTHGYFLRAVVARVLLGDYQTGDLIRRIHKRTYIENTAITVLKYMEMPGLGFVWRLWTFNDHSHFAE